MSGASERLFAEGMTMSAKSVAEIGYSAMILGKGFVITGKRNRLLAFCTRLVPLGFAQRQLAAGILKPEPAIRVDLTGNNKHRLNAPAYGVEAALFSGWPESSLTGTRGTPSGSVAKLGRAGSCRVEAYADHASNPFKGRQREHLALCGVSLGLSISSVLVFVVPVTA